MKTHKKTMYRLGLLLVAWFDCTSVFAGLQDAGRVFIPADSARLVYMGRIIPRIPTQVTSNSQGVSIYSDFEGTSW